MSLVFLLKSVSQLIEALYISTEKNLYSVQEGGVKKIFFGNSKKCSLEILANRKKIGKKST